MNTDREDDSTHWHLDKKVPISIIAVLLMQGFAGMWFVADIKKDVELLKDARLEQRERDSRQDKTAAEATSLLRGDISILSQKLDRLIERGPSK